VVPKGKPKPPASDSRGGLAGASDGPAEKKSKVEDDKASSSGRQSEQPGAQKGPDATPTGNIGGSQHSDSDSGGGGLQGLLGGYGSDSDADEQEGGGGSPPQQRDAGKSSRPPAFALPSAADLLDSSRPVSSTLGPASP
jgi:hypothetical protein